MMTKMLQGATIALICSFTAVISTKLQPSSVYVSNFPYYVRPFNPGFAPFRAATATPTNNKSEDVVQSKALGLIDLVLLRQLTSRLNQLEETIQSLKANSQATNIQLTTLKSDLTTVKDGLGAVKTDLSTLEGTVKGNTDGLDGVKTDLSALQGTVKGNTDGLIGVKTDLSALQGTVKGNTDGLDGVKTDLSALQGTVKGNTDGLDGVKTDLSALQGTVKVNTDGLDGVKTDLSALQGTVKGNTDALDGVKTDLSALQGTVKGNTDGLDGVKTDLSALQGTVKVNTDGLDGVKTDLSALQGTVKGNTDDVGAVKTDLSKLDGTVQGLIDPTSIGVIPASCSDLKNLGNTKSGLYNIKSSTKVGTVYCDFTVATGFSGFEQWIGFADVQTAPVYFHILKDRNEFSSFVPKIPFDREILNLGKAMDLTTGTFTAPVDGTYFFSFTGTVYVLIPSSAVTQFVVAIILNGDPIGYAVTAESNNQENQWESLHLETTLALKKNDQIWLLYTVGGDNTVLAGAGTTSFTGMLLSEENFTS